MRYEFGCEHLVVYCVWPSSFSKEALQQNAQVLELNPEFSTAWNYRKRCVQYLLEQESEEGARKDIAQNELDLVCTIRCSYLICLRGLLLCTFKTWCGNT